MGTINIGVSLGMNESEHDPLTVSKYSPVSKAHSHANGF